MFFKKTKKIKCFDSSCSFTADRLQRISLHHKKCHSVSNFTDTSISIKSDSIFDNKNNNAQSLLNLIIASLS
jgi:hypothetical protein